MLTPLHQLLLRVERVFDSDALLLFAAEEECSRLQALPTQSRLYVVKPGAFTLAILHTRLKAIA